MRRILIVMAMFIVVFAALAWTTQPPVAPSGNGLIPVPGDENWDNRFGALSTDGIVYAIAVNGSDLYFGGTFTMAGGVPAKNIAKWDGTRWSAMGGGTSSAVHAIAVNGRDVYVGGYFTQAGEIAVNCVAKWDGRSWSAMGSGVAGYAPNTSVLALAVIGSDVYVGGQFSTAGNVSAVNVAKWNGENWSALGGGTNARVRALAAVGTDLYAGGEFTAAGGVAVSAIAKWDGDQWSALGSGAGGDVWTMAVSGTDIYVGGYLENRVAKWNGTTWSTLGSGLGAVVWALAVSGNNVYAGGLFTETGDRKPAKHVARWDGTGWSAMDHGLDDIVWALAVSGGNVYAGGQFLTANVNEDVSHIARWNGSSWSSAGGGIDADGDIQAIVATGNNVYVGGEFLAADGTAANNIATYDGNTWSSLGTGVTGGEGLGPPISSIAVSGSNVYVSGWLTGAGTIPVNRVAKWDGSRWSDMGSGIAGLVFALAASGDNVYIGGNFRVDGEIPASYVAKWDGNRWSAMGLGVDGNVNAIAVEGTDVYVGGHFTKAGGLTAQGIAKWDGTRWMPMGGISFSSLYDIAVSENGILASGEFSIGSGSRVNGIAKWDGTYWTVIGELPSGAISAIAVSGSDVLVGGHFTMINGISASNIARWDGSGWSSLGSGISGMNSIVSGLAVREGRVYVGGRFATAGPYPSANFAVWSYPTVVTVSGTVTLNGSPLPGVVMIGLPGSVMTDAQGHFSAPVNFGWSGTITPTLTGHVFSPPATTCANVTSDRTINYTASLQTFTISGTVTHGGYPVANVLMVGLPGNPSTNAQGRYTGRVSFGWSGSAIPTLAGYAFSPVSRPYSAVAADQAGEDYLAVPTTLLAVLTADKVWGEVPLEVACAASQIWDSGGNTFTYTWQLLKDGLPASPILCCSPSVVYTLDAEGEYVVLLTVSDNWGRSATACAVIYAGVNAPPVAKAGPDQNIHAGALAILDGSGSSDPNGNYPLKYTWAILMKPEGSQAILSDPNGMNPSFSVDKEGTYLITLEVADSDDVPGVSYDNVLVSTVNVPPVAAAGPDQAITRVGTTVKLDGTQSYDPDGDSVIFSWTMTSRPANSHAGLNDPSSPAPSFVADVNGIYTVVLTVSDPWLASEPDEIIVTFSNVQPVADAGGNQSVIVGTPVYLNGSGSSDANYDPLTYNWSMVGRPPESEAMLHDTNSVISRFVPDRPGTYVVSLVVNDGTEDSQASNVTVVATASQDTVTQQLIQTTAVINSLDAVVLKNANMVNALTNKINQVLIMMEKGQYAEALDKLRNDILQKVDGCTLTGAPDKNDWIRDCVSQGAVFAEVMKAIVFLEDMIKR